MDQVSFVGQSRSNGDFDEYLRAKTICEQMVFQSFHLIDTGEAEKVRELFIVDGVHTLNDDTFEGAGLTAFFEARQANKGRVTRHTVTNLRFDLESADVARASYISAVYVLGSPQPMPGAVTDIHDTFVKDASGRWMFSRRDVLIVLGGR